MRCDAISTLMFYTEDYEKNTSIATTNLFTFTTIRIWFQLGFRFLHFSTTICHIFQLILFF